MDWLGVLQRIGSGEDDRTEFGRFRSFREKDWLEAVCALANSEGGLVVLGILDDGTIDGVPMDPEEVQERLSNQLADGLSAPVQATLRRHLDPNGWVHWIEVARVRGPEPLTYRGRPKVRLNRRTVNAEGSRLQELYNAFGLILTEERIVPGTTVVDIGEEEFRGYMRRKGIDLAAEPGFAIETDLRNREVLAPDADGTLRATLFGLLCFGVSPQSHSPTRNTYLDLVAYAGKGRHDEVLGSGEARGRLVQQVQRAEEWLRGLGRQERYHGMVREDRWIVPLEAFRECVVNAVAHRDYTILGSKVLVEVFDDRVVVTSPGALPNHKRPESVLAGGVPRSRNEAIANALLDHGLMEQRGSGYPRITRAMRAFNGTAPLLRTSEEERWVRVSLLRFPAVEDE